MRSRITRRGAFRHALLLLGFGAAFGTAYAQVPPSFEYVYGNHCGDGGTKRVSPVFNCSGGGYIAVGSTQTDQCDPGDVYVVRTNSNGTLIWATAYDINSVNGMDMGNSIIECADGSGFVVVGATNGIPNEQVFDAFVMKIDCDGKEVWTRTFGQTNYADFAEDVVEAPAQGGGANDIVVAGFRHLAFTALNHDGWLLRLTSLGGTIWDKTYDLGLPGGSEERFFGVTVTTVAPNAGDIVAVGVKNDGGILGRQGLIMRVTANGTFGGAPRGVAQFGNLQTELFNSVIELQNGAEAGRLVTIGETSNFGSTDIYVVKTRANPCDQAGALAEIAIGNNVGSYGTIHDRGTDLFEVTSAFPAYGGGGVGGGTAVGDLIITGHSNESIYYPVTGTPFHHYNALLLALRVATLNPVGGTGRLFGSDLNEGDSEWGNSLAEQVGTANNDKGIIICGTTLSNLRHHTPPDGSDMYIVKTDNAGNTGCEESWNPPARVLAYQTCLQFVVSEPELGEDADVSENPVETAIDVCPRPFPKVGRGSADESSEISDAIHTYPNPILRGGTVTLQYLADVTTDVTVEIVDELGASLKRWSVPVNGGDNRIGFATDELPAGTYIVTIDDGIEPRHARIVVIGGR